MRCINILWLSWKDITHPAAGGAERYTYEIAKRLVKRGHGVTLFTSRYPQAKSHEEIDGIEIVRWGTIKTVYAHAYYQYKKHLKDKCDLIIEEINGNIPWLTPIYAKKPVVVLRYQVEYSGPNGFYKSVLPYEVSLPIALALYYGEAAYLKLYSKLKIPFITISQSTKQDLIANGIPRSRIHLVMCGLDIRQLNSIGEAKKEKKPIIIFIGRMQRSKRPHHVIEAFKIIKKKIPSCRLWIIGTGYFSEKLQKNAPKDAKFFGKVSEREKIDLLKKTKVLIAPSIREGWGLVVLEANACGTPAIAYDVPGLRDSIVDGKTGILVKENGNIEKLAEAVMKVLKDEKLRKRLSKNALVWSKRFSWDKSAEEFLKIIERVEDKK